MSRSEVTIRPAEATDLPRVMEVEQASFPLPWSESSFRSLLELDRVFFLVAELEGEVVGHGVLWWVGEEGELANIAVGPEARRAGVARVLLEELVDRARRAGVEHVFLEVRVSNDAATRLYRSLGFREVGLRRNYYQRPQEDARILRLDMGGPPRSLARPVEEIGAVHHLPKPPGPGRDE
ncbi:MAG: ribosomal protein S18-alanine N-acetyltransferase [Acidobacteriota bacterium]